MWQINIRVLLRGGALHTQALCGPGGSPTQPALHRKARAVGRRFSPSDVWLVIGVPEPAAGFSLWKVCRLLVLFPGAPITNLHKPGCINQLVCEEDAIPGLRHSFLRAHNSTHHVPYD